MKVTFRMLVLEKYKTVLGFSRAIGWPRQKASGILNGARSMTADDIEKAAALLQIQDSDTFMQLFFPDLSRR